MLTVTRRLSLPDVRAVGTILAVLILLTPSPAGATLLLVENFDDVSTLGARGWTIANNSEPLGTTDWFQGNAGIFSSQGGAADSYIAANFNAADFGGNISDWLISPTLTFNDDDVISFWTRGSALLADRLELRLSLNGASTNVGATAASVGDFTTLLVNINPALSATGYPDSWTLFSATISGLGAATSGRFAFRYNVTDTSANADYIGIDTVSVQQVPEPSTLALLSLGLLAAQRYRRSGRFHQSAWTLTRSTEPGYRRRLS